MVEFLRTILMLAGGAVALLVLVSLYLLPAIIASKKKLPQRRSIAWLNIFLGWTTVGWIVLLIIASLANRPRLITPMHYPRIRS